MKANSDCKGAQCLDVYLNGERLEDCIEADEESGTAWVTFRDADDHLVHEKLAPPRTYIHEMAMVQKVRGKVEIRITPPEGQTEQQVRELIEATYQPLEIKIKGA